MEVYEYPGYRCGPCPPGLQGNGTHCGDINEVRDGGALEGTKQLGQSRSEAKEFRRRQRQQRQEEKGRVS